jgi:hypothetical protein
MIYTCDRNITKSIYLVVKPFIISKREQITVEIEINKTVESLKKAVFQQLGESIANYYNIRLFSLSPTMNELNTPTKTIHQCMIKDSSKLIIIADYGFHFREIVSEANSKTKIQFANGSSTITTTKIIAKKVEEAIKVPT